MIGTLWLFISLAVSTRSRSTKGEDHERPTGSRRSAALSSKQSPSLTTDAAGTGPSRRPTADDTKRGAVTNEKLNTAWKTVVGIYQKYETWQCAKYAELDAITVELSKLVTPEAGGKDMHTDFNGEK